MFLIVTLVTGLGRALMSRKLTPCFIGSYQILQKVGEVAYIVALTLSLSNLHDIFHVSQLWEYIPGSSHVIQLDDVQVRENLIV